MIEIRKAEKKDAIEAERIFQSARLFMRQNGNDIQWNSIYPSAEDVFSDAEKGVGYVMCEDGKIFAYFAFIIGEDPTYSYIEGKWLSSETYGTIHRIASDGTHKGVMKLCVDHCRTICPHIRIDTHEKNLTMRNALARLGFIHCGTIYIEDGSPRMAFCLLP
ncbi:MAG: N-acetyltransferase [Lachnospiraceae bacterium]|nr:N-acetyltransferase [Lachnospiraceae bacterium]